MRKMLVLSIVLSFIGSASALEIKSPKRMLKIEVQNETQITASLCNSRGSKCITESITADSLNQKIQKAREDVLDILSNEELKESIRSKMKSDISKGKKAVYKIDGIGQLSATSHDFVDIVIDEYLPKALISLENFDGQAVIMKSVKIIEETLGQVFEVESEKEMDKNLESIKNQFMLKLN